jgi:phenylacetate-CoA ligase
MKKFLSRHIAYPIYFKQSHYRRKGSLDRLSLLKNMLERERWSIAALEAYQLEQLKKLLVHAGKNVPYYQDLFKEYRFDPARFQHVQELSILPPLTKDIIAKEGKRLLSNDAHQRGVYQNRSSGSTGSPAVFYQDQQYQDHQRVAAWVSDMAAGWRIGDRIARLWGAPHDIDSNTRSAANKLINWLLNQDFYNTHQLSDETMLRYHTDMSRKKPDAIVAYASSAYLFSLFLESRNLQVTYPTKTIITSAEVLHDHMRSAIEQAFNLKVYDRYASRDGGLIGYECDRHNGLHVNMQNVYLECLNDGCSEDNPVLRWSLC